MDSTFHAVTTRTLNRKELFSLSLSLSLSHSLVLECKQNAARKFWPVLVTERRHHRQKYAAYSALAAEATTVKEMLLFLLLLNYQSAVVAQNWQTCAKPMRAPQ